MKINIENYQKQLQQFVTRLTDVRFVGQVVFVVIVLLISWSGVKAIQTNYELQKQIAAIKQQNDVQALENTNLKLQKEYFDSKQYLELSARENFGMAAPGEKEVLVPKSVALAYTVDIPSEPKESAAARQQPAYQKNFEGWVNFFLHRQEQLQ